MPALGATAGRSGSWAGGAAQVASGGRGGLVWLARWSTRQAHQDLFSPRRGGCSRRGAGGSEQAAADQPAGRGGGAAGGAWGAGGEAGGTARADTPAVHAGLTA